MLSFIAWYLLLLITGWIAFPLAFRFLRFLPDRGYTMARALGWMIWGYVFWLAASFGLMTNNTGGLLLAFLVLAGISLWAAGGKRGLYEIFAWIKGHRKLVFSAEAVFLAAFGAWALMRAMMPEISGTEKPMELAFINAILASPDFPPHDPWLSGYAISYYYFGYVLIAMLARLTGTQAGVAFNLGISLVFGLSALGAYGVLYNLLNHFRPGKHDDKPPETRVALPLFGPLFLLLVSNMEGFLEMLHARGLFWQQNFDGTWISGFWRWLGILELNQPPTEPLTWMPSRPQGVVWWRASRVLADYGFDGSHREVIDEFPFFSYLLGDMHPHVLAMPFALLAISLALNVFLAVKNGELKIGRLTLPLHPLDFTLTAVVLGGMSFLNTWDFPIYIALFCGAYILAQARQSGWHWALAGDFLKLALALGICGGLLYLPFYTGFASQAGGVLPSIIFFTTGRQFWIMFAPLLAPILAWLVYRKAANPAGFPLRKGLRLSAIIVAGLWILSYLFTGLTSLIASYRDLFLSNQGMPGGELGLLILQATLNRLKEPGAWLTLLFLLGLALAALFWPHRDVANDVPETATEIAPAGSGPDSPDEEHTAVRRGFIDPGQFALLLILLGVLLTLAPEFFYLLDQFGGRMNTIFKFYFQAWMVWSLAAAFGSAVLWQALRGVRGVIFRAGFGLLLLASLVYAPAMLFDRTAGFSPPDGLSLDGLASFRAYNPEDAAVIEFLKSTTAGVVVEAAGGQYTSYARIATQTGLPGVLGWPGHESQWRGGDELFVNRFGDIDRLYSTTGWPETEAILRQYSIRYVVISGLERSTYRVYEKKFQDNLQQVFSEGSAVVYEVPDRLLAGEAQPAEALTP